MTLVGKPIPPRPAVFSPAGAPPGVAVDFNALRGADGRAWYLSRTKIKPRIGIVHTNAAEKEGTLQSSINWGNGASGNTKPHYHLNWPQPTKVVPTDRQAIANATEDWFQAQEHEVDCALWTYSIETADTGTLADREISDFLTVSKYGAIEIDHAEIVARILAYESIVWNHPIELPEVWNGTGVAAHTDPFGHPCYTTSEGKTCPGPKKKARLRNDIYPRAREIRAAWLGEDQPMYEYFTLKPVPATLWQKIAPGVAVRVEGDPLGARGGLGSAPVVLTQAEADKFVFLNGLTNASVE
jgi:hypothetical protein